MARLVVTLAATLVLVMGCKEFNPEACLNPENKDDPRCLVDAAPVMCDTTCAGTDVCLNHVCVQCTAAQHDACSGVTPACDDVKHVCVGCTSHDQCLSTSDVCAPEGNCADANDVAYIATSGNDGNTCTQTSKCKTMTRALTQITQTRRYIKIEDQANDASVTTINNQDVTILAEPTATMHNTAAAGPILQITGTSKVRIFDLTLENATGAVNQASAIVMSNSTGTLELVRATIFNNQSTGIVVTGGSKLTMNRCVVVRNSIAFGDGGISVFNVDFDITNSVFASNGGTGSVSGGAFLKPLSTSTFEFNTVANNASMSGPIGVNCVVGMALANNIVSGNVLTAGCSSTYSLFDIGPPAGNGNVAGAADFKNTAFSNPHAIDFFRLNDGSVAKDRADPTTNMKVDIDGDLRPQGDHADIGADEIRKP